MTVRSVLTDLGRWQAVRRQVDAYDALLVALRYIAEHDDDNEGFYEQRPVAQILHAIDSVEADLVER